MPTKQENADKSNKIKKLNSKGHTVTEISKMIGCSKGVVRYHLGYKNTEVYKKHKQKYLKTRHPFVLKYYKYINPKIYKPKNPNRKNTDKQALTAKVFKFIYRNELHLMSKNKFNVKDIINKYGDNPICYLTGEQLNIYDTKTYQFDHIIPSSKGGDNSLDNLGICTSEANKAKQDMTPEQFIILCKKVLEYNGYQVLKV